MEWPWSSDAVVATQLPEETSPATASRLATRTGASQGEPPADIRRAIASITALLEGDNTDLTDITCDFGRIDPFAATVYEATRTIPAGKTRTYGAIALQLGDPQLAQRVGRALARNPVPIIVPSHRVVGANDTLIGFSAYGGVETKRKMLAIEGARIGDAPALFGDLPLVMKPRR